MSATLALSGMAIVLATIVRSPAADAAQPTVGLGTATPYAVLAGQSVSNTGPSVISGDLGVSPGTSVVGFPPGLVQAGTIHAADATALQAQNDLTTAYLDAAGRGPVVDQTDKNLGGQTLVAGTYGAASGMALRGTVTLDAKGDPAAVFVFQAGSTLITASDSRVALVNGAQACNVFWQVGSSATLGTRTSLVGTVMALTSITARTNATIRGRLLARNGSVTLDDNRITRPRCSTTTPSEPSEPGISTQAVTPSTPPDGTLPTPSSDTPTTSTPGTTPPDGATTPEQPRVPPGFERVPPPSGATPPVPVGHPPTGRASAPRATRPATTQDAFWLGLGLIALGGLAGATGRARGQHRSGR